MYHAFHRATDDMTFDSIIERDPIPPLVVRDQLIHDLNRWYEEHKSALIRINAEILEATDIILTENGAYRRLVYIDHTSSNNTRAPGLMGYTEISTWIEKRMIVDGAAMVVTFEFQSSGLGVIPFKREIANEIATFYGFEISEVSFAR
jgi:hypothetical protein